ncbi:MAG TPA: alpha-amylase family protein [Tepidisphaeraceae bacterium]|nr:alpha-amylase family protein [Tepidisphaeraceae bacterium]
MPKITPLRFRQVHLDFHTSPAIRDVGVEFDAREFARTMKVTQVDSVTVFAKCHHGHLYYQTKHPARHPGLSRGLDLLGQQVDALHAQNIRAPIYISILCDEFAADNNPEWVALNPDGTRVGRGPLSNVNGGWQILDMSSPYQDYVAEQTREILQRFKPVDGIFFDMCWDQPSVSRYAKTEMAQWGLSPADEQDRIRHAHRVALAYMKRFYEMVRASSKGATVFFNGRGHGNLREEMAYQTQHEIESLPTGGWGYAYFPKNVRLARTLPTPYMGMTARFHKSWADFGGLKPQPALDYETQQMIANGARCSIGDQMHPRGTLDAGAYELIGRTYAHIAACEPWLTGASALAQIAVLQPPERKVGQGSKPPAGASEGVVRMLTQLKHQFDLVDVGGSLDGYELLILPDAVELDDALLRKVRAFLKDGGRILASGTSGLSTDARQLLLGELGVRPHGMSPFTTTYIRFAKPIALDVPPSDHVMYERCVRVTPAKGTGTVARVVEPYFERTWDHFSSHFQTPAERLTRYAAATLNGQAAYIAAPIFGAYARHGSIPYRLLVRNLLDKLLPDPLLRVAAPAATEATVMRQNHRTIVHLLHYSPERRTEKLDLIEDVIPLFDLPLSLRTMRPPQRVYVAPQQTPLEFEHLAGRVNLRVPEVRGHVMIVFE